jgi:succinyl-CoA synthetase alpha subunit
MVMVPAPFTKDAILEAHEAGIRTIVTITEGVPVHDMTIVYDTVVRRGGARLIGPNCPGLISPGKANIGIIPGDITMPGRVGLVSRSGTLTYQIMYELAQAGIGISTCVGIGGDPVIGTQFLDVIQAFAADSDTDAIAFVGEIGGSEEQRAGEWIRDNIPDMPVVGYIAGFEAPAGKQMGHAGAIVKEDGPGGESAAEKQAILAGFGIPVADNPSDAARLMIERLGRGPTRTRRGLNASDPGRWPGPPHTGTRGARRRPAQREARTRRGLPVRWHPMGAGSTGGDHWGRRVASRGSSPRGIIQMPSPAVSDRAFSVHFLSLSSGHRTAPTAMIPAPERASHRDPRFQRARSRRDERSTRARRHECARLDA